MRLLCSEALDAYRQALCDLISELLRGRQEVLWKLLRLNREKDSNFLWTAMYIVGDTSIAIQNFLRFGLDGPTKYDDGGERYLRLYGLSNASYIQQDAVLKLYTLLNVPDPKKAKERIDRLQIRSLRHKVGAHGIDYMNKNIGKIETFVPVRARLGQFTCEYMNNETQAIQRVDLKEYIEEHSKLIVELLARIYEKAAKTAYKGNEKKLQKHKEKLHDLKIIGDGGVVMKLPGGHTFIINRLK
jgi:hypothetical protein